MEQLKLLQSFCQVCWPFQSLNINIESLILFGIYSYLPFTLMGNRQLMDKDGKRKAFMETMSRNLCIAFYFYVHITVVTWPVLPFKYMPNKTKLQRCSLFQLCSLFLIFISTHKANLMNADFALLCQARSILCRKLKHINNWYYSVSFIEGSESALYWFDHKGTPDSYMGCCIPSSYFTWLPWWC